MNMRKAKPDKVNIFISIDQQVIMTYFNTHDPAPLYKRQLSHQFEQYLLKSAEPVKRYSIIFYKLKCSNDIDRQLAEPLIYAIKRHFAAQTERRRLEFSKYKRKSFMLLAMSFMVLMFCHGALPLLVHPNTPVQTILLTSFDVFSWVMFWRPIDKLVFDWNPHLKDISLLNKLSTAEMMIVNTNADVITKPKPIMVAVS